LGLNGPGNISSPKTECVYDGCFPVAKAALVPDITTPNSDVLGTLKPSVLFTALSWYFDQYPPPYMLSEVSETIELHPLDALLAPHSIAHRTRFELFTVDWIGQQICGNVLAAKPAAKVTPLA
jgi:hypothetical protein